MLISKKYEIYVFGTKGQLLHMYILIRCMS